MLGNRVFSLVSVTLAAIGLSGCVAAAIPVIAGGALLSTDAAHEDARSRSTTALPAAAELTERPLASLSGEAEGPAIPTGAAQLPYASTGRSQPLLDASIAALVAYAEKQADAARGGAPVVSALLEDKVSLSTARKPCRSGTMTVLVDLDPADGLFSTEAPLASRGGLATALRAIRAAGIEVAWLSERSAADAGAIREALAEADLDPGGRDRLLLTRYPSDRKQTLREDLAESVCLFAIAGDERSDFDELFDYLRKPEMARGLDSLIGRGWFSIPFPKAPHEGQIR